MRRGIMAVLVLLLSCAAVPQAAEARPRLFKMLGIITNPVGAILGAGQKAGRRAAHKQRSRTVQSRKAPAAAVAGTAAGTGAAAAVAAAPSPAAKWEDAAPTEFGTSQIESAAGNVSDTKPASEAKSASGSGPAQRTAAATQADVPSSSPSAGTTPARLGTVGPLAWPGAFEDVIGYSLWPKDYTARLRGHGIGDVLITAFTPSAALTARARPDGKSESKSTVGSASSTGPCDADAVSSDWPANEIKRSLGSEPTPGLDELQTAIRDAAARIRLACRDAAAPVDRLRAMQNMLWAVHEAAQTIRAPLAKFYDQLSDEQKRRFMSPADSASAGRQELMKSCAPSEQDMPMKSMERSLHPTSAQKASLDALQKKSFEMGQFLMTSCLKPLAETPAERLDAATGRLTAVIFAASNVNVALNEFTNQLSPEQKAKLDSLGR